MKSRRLLRIVVWIAMLTGVATPVFADVGVPMIFITLPGMLVALVPIIALEAYLLGRQLTLSRWPAVKASSFANIVSTVVGMPVTWLLLVVLQMVTGGGGAYGLDTPLQRFLAVTWQAPWLIPYDTDLGWMMPAAVLSLMVPFFFASWLIEYLVCRAVLRDVDRPALSRSVRNANIASYGLLAVIVLCMLIHAIAGG